MKIKLTEKKLQSLIKESVKNTLSEMSYEYPNSDLYQEIGNYIEELSEVLGYEKLIDEIIGKMEPREVLGILKHLRELYIDDEGYKGSALE